MANANVAVIVAHPDDEVLAFGGTMYRHADDGDTVSTLILATGLASRNDTDAIDDSALAELREDAAKANRLLGVSDLQFGDFPDNRMDTVPLLDVVKRVQAFIQQKQPQVVYSHHDGDLNIDHGVVARAVLTACRPVPGSAVRYLFSGEILSSTEYGFPETRFAPNCYVGIEDQLSRKCEAMNLYGGEVREWPHPRSADAIKHQARLRGSECGYEAAEGMSLIRAVQPSTDGLLWR